MASGGMPPGSSGLPNLENLATRISALIAQPARGRKPVWLAQFASCGTKGDVKAVLEEICTRDQLVELKGQVRKRERTVAALELANKRPKPSPERPVPYNAGRAAERVTSPRLAAKPTSYNEGGSEEEEEDPYAFDNEAYDAQDNEEMQGQQGPEASTGSEPSGAQAAPSGSQGHADSGPVVSEPHVPQPQVVRKRKGRPPKNSGHVAPINNQEPSQFALAVVQPQVVVKRRGRPPRKKRGRPPGSGRAAAGPSAPQPARSESPEPSGSDGEGMEPDAPQPAARQVQKEKKRGRPRKNPEAPGPQPGQPPAPRAIKKASSLSAEEMVATIHEAVRDGLREMFPDIMEALAAGIAAAMP